MLRTCSQRGEEWMPWLLVALALVGGLSHGFDSEVTAVGIDAEMAMMDTDDTYSDLLHGDLGEAMTISEEATKGKGKKAAKGKGKKAAKGKGKKAAKGKIKENGRVKKATKGKGKKATKGEREKEPSLPPKLVVPTVKPKASAKTKAKAAKKASKTVAKLATKQIQAIAAKTAATKAQDKADELKRLATVKTGSEKKKILKKQKNVAKIAQKDAKIAAKTAVSALKTKLGIEAKAKTNARKATKKLEKTVDKAQKKVTKMAIAKAKLKNAQKPKPHNPDVCGRSFSKATAKCKKQKNKSLGCVAKAKVIYSKCKKANFKMKKAKMKADGATKLVTSVKKSEVVATKTLKALKKYKDKKPPRLPPGPIGIFEHNHLFYLTNEDGSKSWIKYPTKNCKRARRGVPPEQFPNSKTKFVLNKKQSRVACYGGPFNGATKLAFYPHCACNGLKNKKGNGGFCGKFGYAFKWCYVSKKCKFGNSALSKELKNVKVLAGCKARKPSL